MFSCEYFLFVVFLWWGFSGYVLNKKSSIFGFFNKENSVFINIFFEMLVDFIKYNIKI